MLFPLRGGGGFLSISDNIRYKRTKEFYEQHGGVVDNLLKLGYPGLDKPIARYNEFCKDKEESNNNLIIFLSLPHSPFIEVLIELITESLQNGYKVLYKTHGGHLELLDKEREIVKRWQDNEKFVVCYETLSDEILFESLCVVEFRSSILYTYPLITKKPALYLQPQFESYNEEDNFYCSNLHIKIHNKEEFLDTLIKLQDENFRVKRKDLIEEYINSCAYNLGGASYAVADFVDIFLKKYI
ncbi:CDP-glycerol glycerophosphotransferase family protein [Helicobacter ibis]|uniref:CDP-glycerol glycerophosphotransferase family protein n=1 Tax=Helicobacter ibis TaxID=2962633 RepID=A0ABT4VC80_9HELI|nr:CDP-glycerol glycerophosphotransferase family protein [Helicobacter ibis]MDA3968310.1 CDP-glycerol glycerophosphotransferase family protein [Helicobacter ibis]